MISEHPNILWEPSKKDIENSHIHHYMDWLRSTYQIDFSSYDDLWEWSIAETATFWKTIAEYFEVIFHDSPTEVLIQEGEMPHQNWFPGATLNYAEHIFRKAAPHRPAIIHKTESRPQTDMSWEELRASVAALAAFLKEKGVSKGDRVAAFMTNTPEATIGFLATISLGAVWSSCSPDFGADSVRERFEQIEPKVLLAVNGYSYGGKLYDKSEVVRDIANSIPSIEQLIGIHLIDADFPETHAPHTPYEEIIKTEPTDLIFETVPFDHPIWVLYSSGTTGKPKAITHSHGGVLLEHLKYMALHNDVHSGERFFWFSTTGWMMWNFTQASLLMGATMVLYDGSAGYPNIESMWFYAQEAKINHFGTSAPFIVACMKSDIHPNQDYDLTSIRSIGSTGAPLPPEGFDWVYQNINDRVWLCSMSGGTDVCTAFLGGVPLLPVYQGEIQRPALGSALFAYNEAGERVTEEVGEMVIEQPMPSMPIYFWGDDEKARYKSSYFETFPGRWRHGDWIYITARRTIVILGRSDATLNRQGVRIGTAEIYRAVEQMESIQAALIVNIEQSNGNHFMPLFLQMQEGQKLTDDLQKEIKRNLRSAYSPRHVPDAMIEVADIPRTISGKKMETPVKKILMGMSVDAVASKDAMQNPESLDFFISYAQNLDT
jgi:acetoacetyl-CoA synthetase